MNTQCPICRTAYRFTYAVAAARGIAECGQCGSVFDALTSLELVDQTPAPEAEAEGATEQTAGSGDRQVYRSSGLPGARPWTPEMVGIPEVPHDIELPASAQRRRGPFKTGLAALALRNIARYRRRSLVAIGAVGAGVIAILLSGGFIEWMLEAQRESSIRSQYGHIEVVREGFFEEGAADPTAYLLPGEAELLEVLPDNPDVETVAPRLYFSGLASHGETSISFIGQGVDPAREKGLRESINIRRGEPLSPERKHEAVVGIGLAGAIGVDVGDNLVLLSSAGGINAVEVEVAGLFVTARKAFDDSALRIPIDLARDLLRADGSHSWLVLLRDTALTDRMKGEVDALVAGIAEPVEVATWYELDDFYKKTEELFSSQVNLVRGVIGLLILLSISNTMMMSVMDRTREIGTLMALGFTRRKVLALFLEEGFILGAIGAVIGLVLGVALAELISYVGIPMPPAPQMSEGFTAGITLNATLVVAGALVAVIFTTAAAAYPAWKASRLDIVDALRHNR